MWLEDVKRTLEAAPEETRSDPRRMFDEVVRLYAEVRIEGVRLDEDGDMLLFQWGTYDWGEGERFELDLTRQVILRGNDPGHPVDDPDNYAIIQLCCTYRFRPEVGAGLGQGDHWCRSPDEIGSLRSILESSPSLQRASGAPFEELQVALEDVG